MAEFPFKCSTDFTPFFQQMAALREEYGWPLSAMEQAINTAVRLCYMDTEDLVEVYVDMAIPWISVRQRIGAGETGHWLDLETVKLPSQADVLDVMDMQQWGDGAPGRVVEATVVEVTPAGIVYHMREHLLFVAENLLPTRDKKKPPIPGARQVVSLLSYPKKAEDMRPATRMGGDFVLGVMQLFVPDSVSTAWMGSSNTWAVLKIRRDKWDAWMAEGGANLEHLKNMCGLSFITAFPASNATDNVQQMRDDLTAFLRTLWPDAQAEWQAADKLVVYSPPRTQEAQQRAVASVLEKMLPGVRAVIQ